MLHILAGSVLGVSYPAPASLVGVWWPRLWSRARETCHSTLWGKRWLPNAEPLARSILYRSYHPDPELARGREICLRDRFFLLAAFYSRCLWQMGAGSSTRTSQETQNKTKLAAAELWYQRHHHLAEKNWSRARNVKDGKASLQYPGNGTQSEEAEGESGPSGRGVSPCVQTLAVLNSQTSSASGVGGNLQMVCSGHQPFPSHFCNWQGHDADLCFIQKSIFECSQRSAGGGGRAALAGRRRTAQMPRAGEIWLQRHLQALLFWRC